MDFCQAKMYYQHQVLGWLAGGHLGACVPFSTLFTGTSFYANLSKKNDDWQTHCPFFTKNDQPRPGTRHVVVITSNYLNHEQRGHATQDSRCHKTETKNRSKLWLGEGHNKLYRKNNQDGNMIQEKGKNKTASMVDEGESWCVCLP